MLVREQARRFATGALFGLGRRGDLELHRKARADREALAHSEAAHLAGIDPVFLPDAGRAEAGEVLAFELAGREVDAARAAGLHELLRGVAIACSRIVWVEPMIRAVASGPPIPSAT